MYKYKVYLKLKLKELLDFEDCEIFSLKFFTKILKSLMKTLDNLEVIVKN